MNPIFTPRRLGHVNLFVEQLDRSTRFYRDACGLALEFSETGLLGNFLGTGNTHHDIGIIERALEDRYGKDGHLQIPKAVGGKVGLNHVAWEMESELDLVQGYERARSAGVSLSRISDHQITRSIYLKDPDVNTVEFYADVIRDWRSVLHGEVDHITSVWKPDARTASPEKLWDPAPTPRRIANADVHPQRLSHVVLQTANLAEMTRFYRETAGLELVYSDEDAAFLRGSDAASRYHLALVQAPQGKGLHHFSFELARPDDASPAQLSTGPLKSSCFKTDPDGFVVEFFVRGADHYREIKRASPAERAFLA